MIANGKLGDPERAEQMLIAGAADLIAVGTSALANPDWVNKIREGGTLRAFDHRFLQPMATLKEEEVLG